MRSLVVIEESLAVAHELHSCFIFAVAHELQSCFIVAVAHELQSCFIFAVAHELQSCFIFAYTRHRSIVQHGSGRAAVLQAVSAVD